MRHLTTAKIASLLAAAAGEEAEECCRHLAEVCPDCGERLAEVEALMKRFRHWNPEVVVVEGLVADGLLDALLATDPASWAAQVEEETDFQTWGVAWVALERARAILDQGESQALDLALLAAKIAGHLGTMYHPEWVADLKALSHATAALAIPPSNAEARLREMGAATAALREGTGDEAVNREVVELLARVFSTTDR
ncbi:MAG TPA: hypothetical protein VH988_06265 [Thermoanaerobaculia bacterium]|jgi:hypothetical protein|nr:hypothetical protein [Thermoanaerobaculia bacterium]